MPRTRDETSGRYSDTFSDAAFVTAIQELGGAAGTREIADRLDCHRDTARRRLNQLTERGEVERRDVGDAALWSLMDADSDGQEQEGETA